MNSFVPLLSGRPLSEFSPSEYKLYVTGLYFKREPKKSAPKKKKMSELKVTARVLKSGKVSITTKRGIKYVTEEEAKEIEAKVARPANEVFLCLKAANFIISTHGEAERIRGELNAIPF